jgi:geranylgeranyl diphosphate synthase type II
MTNHNDISLESYLESRRAIINEALNQHIPGDDAYPPIIFKAIRHSLFAGGKRLRPILCLAAAEAVGGDIYVMLPVACALEFIHTYSLIHDDLPAMDNDDYRRGKPTLHKAFNEAVAILAGDALLTEAFRLMSDKELSRRIPAQKILDAIQIISKAAGCFGMIGGQPVDILSEGTEVDAKTLHYIHTRKTGVMIVAAVKAGALLSNATEKQILSLSAYAENIGLAFQIADDILNVEGDPKVMGKKSGTDACRGKITFPALMGIESSRTEIHKLVERAIIELANFDHHAIPLKMIAQYVMERNA